MSVQIVFHYFRQDNGINLISGSPAEEALHSNLKSGEKNVENTVFSQKIVIPQY